MSPESQALAERIKREGRRTFEESTRAIESFTARLTRLNQRIHLLPHDDSLATSRVLYNRLEDVLIRFEEIEMFRPQDSRTYERNGVSKAIEACRLRSVRIDGAISRLPRDVRVAARIVLHRELEAVVRLFEQLRAVRPSSRALLQPASQFGWN